VMRRFRQFGPIFERPSTDKAALLTEGALLAKSYSKAAVFDSAGYVCSWHIAANSECPLFSRSWSKSRHSADHSEAPRCHRFNDGNARRAGAAEGDRRDCGRARAPLAGVPKEICRERN